MDRTRGLCCWISMALGFVIACTWAAKQEQFQKTCDQIRADTLRLHIVADSDTVADQSIKLRVRDAILVETARICKNADTREEAQLCVASCLPRLDRVAASVLARAGRPVQVHTQMEHNFFSTTHYPGATLPAGEYDALRITLGQGKGHNWFCVLHPTLCMAAAGAQYEEENENALITANGCEIRFALVEWWEKLRCNRSC